MFTVEATETFTSWLDGLSDERAAVRIAIRIERLRAGLVGDAKTVGGGVSELRVDHGPGYRVYFTRTGETIQLLLCGGDKRTQKRDIARTQAMAAEIAGARDEQGSNEGQAR